MYTDEQIEPYLDEMNYIKNDIDLISFMNKYKNTQDYIVLLEYICNVYLDFIQREFYQYNDKILKNHPDIKSFLTAANLIETDELPFYQAVAAYFQGKKTQTIRLLEKAIPKIMDEIKDRSFDDIDFALYFIAPFKSAFSGFWDKIYEMLSQYPVKEEVLELCKATPIVYYSKDYNEIRSVLEKVLTVAPESTVAKELLAYNYYQEKLWGNAVALFEEAEPFSIFSAEDVDYMMGYCYGMLKESANEIAAYERSVEINPAGSFAMNNLGYAYYKAKQYQKALTSFQKCIDNNWDIRYAANNYVRTLLAMKRYKDAKTFVKNSPAKVSKDLLDRVKKAENKNQRIIADQPITPTMEIFDNTAVGEKKIDIGIKKQQFTSEKILEDEIVLRMESGIEIFGKHLRIYRRKGIYGRQYILSNGKRLDLLAEDSEGNLYIIELKKDSGYDDAYAQIMEYLEWFDKNWKEKTKNIYGIICLNNPSQELIDKVHRNDRLKLFEYQISYSER